ncbi:MAG: AAA family ATPase, partial [Gimesia sp.]
NNVNTLMNELIVKVKKLEDEYDFVLIEGVRHSFLTNTINFDLNIKIAQNLGSPIINIISAKNKTIVDIHDDILIENENLTDQGCTHFATFINRLDDKQHEQAKFIIQNQTSQAKQYRKHYPLKNESIFVFWFWTPLFVPERRRRS